MNDDFTKAIHAGETEPRIEGAVSLPIFQTANYEYTESSDYADIKYARLNNSPNHVAVHRKIASLEKAEDALVLASGMAAISTTLLALLKSGDHVLSQKTLYGATYGLFKEVLPAWNITWDSYAGESELEKFLKPNTKLLYLETVSNPLMEVPDFSKLLAFARKHKLLTVVDNTFATPMNFKPVEFGFDVSVHSASKYMNGHSDLIAGAVIGRKEMVRKINHLALYLGGTLDAHACSLLHRGLKTLPLRLERQQQTAMALATYLNTHPKVNRVMYPGLESHTSFENARKYLGGFGAMLSFELKNEDRAQDFLKTLKLPVHAASLGGVESLVIRPAVTSHMALGPEGRKKAGISEGLIRLSVGLEGFDDLKADLDRALNLT